MFCGNQVALIIPVLNEEAVIGRLVSAIDRSIVDHLIVVNNGSTDQTGMAAARAGAQVVDEPRHGYGSACLAGLRYIGDAEIVVFMDGDGSDDPRQIRDLLDTLISHRLDMVIGSRVLGETESGALTPVQALGNWLTTRLVQLFWGVRYTDLGPFRAIRRSALDRLKMEDRDFGWTIEMQVKAAQLGMTTRDLPVRRFRRRSGKSKISGTVIGSFHAGRKILRYIVVAKVREWLAR